MKKLIEQIKQMKGVVTVEPAGEDMAVVVFEPKDERKLREWLKEMMEKEPLTLKPEELVEGEIYVAEGVDYRAESIFRYKYTNLNCLGFYINKDCHFVKFQTLRHATTSEKQTLIKEEVKNGFFYELNKK